MPSSDPNYPTAHPRFAVGSSPSTALGCAISAVLGLMMTLGAGSTAHAGDILRGGAPAGAGNRPSSASTTGANPAMTARARANANDALSRTTKALQSVRSMQDAARAAAIARPSNLGLSQKNGRPLPKVPNGLVVGGLQVAPGVPKDLLKPAPSEDRTLWTGANLPTQRTSGGETNVTIRQTKQTAVLNWKTFNIGKETTLTFDQGLGGSRKGEWIAFNKVNDPSGVPSQILGSIKADGQVYVINQNGIIFGGASQINTRTLVASTLPINDNLIQQGLLNNRDAQFLFSALPVPGGSDGTPAFNPTVTDPEFLPTAEALTYTFQEIVALTKTKTLVRTPDLTYRGTDGAKLKLVAGTDYTVNVDTTFIRGSVTFTPAGLAKLSGASVTATYTPHIAKSGNIVVQPGAILTSPVTGDGNGGRVMLVGANVTNAGTISTPAGQTILAAGLQVGIAAHASTDPSLRGLDVWVGVVEPGTGNATNSGLIESLTGSVSMTGREVNQLGAIESSTTVDLNGRIDLRASYGAVGNPGFDFRAAAPGPTFLYQNTGVVRFGEGSSTRILPDYLSESTIPGRALPGRSQINVEGVAIHMGPEALVMAPSGAVTFRAGIWPYKDIDGDRTTINSNLNPPAEENGLSNFFTGANQRFFLSSGQIYLDPQSLITVAGSTEVLVPLAQSILDVEFRGSEFADAPLQREGLVRAIPLTVDIRRTGVANGRFWMGTPLGDVTGLAGLIQRNAAQLTAAGGDVTLQAGGSIVLQDGSTVDVSGGYFQHEGGMVKTTRLLQQGRLVDIADARPDQVYDGVFTGKFAVTHEKYGITETYSVPFMTGERFEPGYVEGAAGGNLTLSAPSMALDGEMLGLTVEGPRQRSERAAHSRLSLAFEAERINPINQAFIRISPTPPSIVFVSAAKQPVVSTFALNGNEPTGIGSEREDRVVLSPNLLKEQGFGHLTVVNPDGEVSVPAGVTLATSARGSIALTGSNVNVEGSIIAPSGELTFRALNLSPTFLDDLAVLATPQLSNPLPNLNRGQFNLSSGAKLDASGVRIDDRVSAASLVQPLALTGGTITIEAFSADLASGSAVDVSGGARMSASGQATFGNGGSLNILTGRDLTITSVVGGELQLGAKLSGYSGATGASLSLRAMMIQVGGVATSQNTLLLQPGFFREGGFTNYTLTGFGMLSPLTGAEGEPPVYLPAVSVAAGTVIAPVAESWLVAPQVDSSSGFQLRPILRQVGLRAPASISLIALGSDDPLTLTVLEARGDIVIGEGARIQTDPGASITLEGGSSSLRGTITLLGSLIAPGGTVSLKGGDRFPGTPDQVALIPHALPTVHIGSTASISTAGSTILLPDPYGRRVGTVSNGGVITIYGNILAEKGAVLDVSGTAATLDVRPVALGDVESPIVAFQSGVNSPLWRLRTIPTTVDSSGGLLEIEGAQMLLSDATLLGKSGGRTAGAGTLSIHSGRFYQRSATGILQGVVNSSDINLTVIQDGNVIPGSGALGIGQPVLSDEGTPITGMGYFAVDRFHQGGFDSLELGAKFLATQVPGGSFGGGGNIEFDGAVSINARGYLRIAAGGVISATAPVSFNAPYIAMGQPFRAPLNPGDPVPTFQQSVNGTVSTSPLVVPPVFGTGSLALSGQFIDLGTVSLQNVGRAVFHSSGDIRGNGTVAVQGDLNLRADQVYPTTLSTLNLVAYDPALGSGSVTIESGGASTSPMSVGGTLNVFASRIVQRGVLTAPLGSITLGWDGKTDYDRSDADIDAPSNVVVGNALPAPIAARVILAQGSITSVAALDSVAGAEMLLPFGISPDGFSWVDPRGVNVTSNGLPEKRVFIAGESVNMRAGATIDIRGGGDLYAFRSTLGIGGSADRLGTATTEWAAGASYQSGDLVLFNGQTFTARVASTGERPAINLFWSRIDESFAVIPGFNSDVAPFNPFNTGLPASQLQGDPGYVFTPNLRGDRVFTSLAAGRRVNTGLQVGDQIELGATPGLEAGSYTLLPRRYALLPGAFLITPQAGDPLGTIALPEGGTLATGYRFNTFTPDNVPELQTRFEVASSEVTRARSGFIDYLGNDFFSEAAERLEIDRPQLLPLDAGYAGFHGNSAIALAGDVLTGRPADGRGASIDVSSFAGIFVTDTGSAPFGVRAILDTNTLASWGAESLLIGGLRRLEGDKMVVDVRTSNLELHNPGGTFEGPEITLVSRVGLSLTAGSSIASVGGMSQSAEHFFIEGDGTLVRVSADPRASITRTGVVGGSTTPILAIGSGARVGGQTVILDSTYGTKIDDSVSIDASTLKLSSGQISIILDPQSGGLVGSVVEPHLTISGKLLQEVEQVNSLILRSYRTIDLYGAGTFGSPTLQQIALLASGIRGYGQGDGTFTFKADNVGFKNPNSLPGSILPAPSLESGSLEFKTQTVRLGSGAFTVSGYDLTTLNAVLGVVGRREGSFSVSGDLTLNAPLITGEQGSSQTVTSSGTLLLDRLGKEAGVSGGLGASLTFVGAEVIAQTKIRLSSGELTLRALTGEVTVGGDLRLSGTTKKFFDLTRYSDAGTITLVSDTGDVALLERSTLSVASAGLGKAGTIDISAGQGSFLNQGTLLGGASEDGNSGTFLLDVLAAPDYAELNDPLEEGGFFKKRDLRIRSGDVTIAGKTRTLDFTLSADTGSITVTGEIDAQGKTGGKIVLVSGESLSLKSGALLDVHAEEFSAAGKGGSVRLEAGAAIDGVSSSTARLNLAAGSVIDLGVDAFVGGGYTDPESSAFLGKFQGTLHLRAPRPASDLQIDSLAGEIRDASSILAEGFRVYEIPDGVFLDPTFRETIKVDAASFMDSGYTAMETRLLSSHPELSDLLVIAPGVEIFSRGDLVLGTDADDATNDWDLSGFRFGPKNAPGVLTMRAAGNLEFKNALSDGFAGDFSPNDYADVPSPGQELWLRPLMDIVSTLPTNSQSWSYRLAAGADLSATDFRRVETLRNLSDGKGSLTVGKFYPATLVSGVAATTSEAINNRFQVVRTGTGSISIAAGRDVQLRNQFATVYSAGVRLPFSNSIASEGEVRTMSIFSANDFAVPFVELSPNFGHPSQPNDLGAPQQAYPAQYSMAGGDVFVVAQRDIVRFSVSEGQIDSSRQLPNNWLYRRGYVDPETGLFGNGAPQGFGSDLSASTTWWIDFSSFFQGFGTLGGGDITLQSDRNIINADAVAATNARMPGRNAATGQNLAPDATKLVELGGGDVTIRAGNNIDGGIYYVERGRGDLYAGGEIKTNAARTPSLGILSPSGGADVGDPLTWLPTTLFVGKSQFDVSAAGDILLGPVTNPFLLPQGTNNKFWYKTYFNTYSQDAGVSVASFGGSVTHRFGVTLGSTAPKPILQAFLEKQNILSANNASFYEPWIRLAETTVTNFDLVATVGAPTLRSTAFAGDIKLVGTLNLFPSPRGTLELAASQEIIGLQPSGTLPSSKIKVWSSSLVNLSDADPARIPGVGSPIAYQVVAGVGSAALSDSVLNPLVSFDASFQETGAFTGFDGSVAKKQALHGVQLLHAKDPNPVRVYALGGDITALTLFTPKATQIAASNDISDIAFYIQNASAQSVSFVAAGRDIIPFNENTDLRTFASDRQQGNVLAGTENRGSVTGASVVSLPGDLQISGQGVLEVLAGRNLDLGTGPNLRDGTGFGLTSIGNARNLSLPVAGADLIVFAGVSGRGGVGPALGLNNSSLDFEAFISSIIPGSVIPESPYLAKLGTDRDDETLSAEQQAIVALEDFYRILREAGRNSTLDGFDAGFAAIDLLFGTEKESGEIFTRTRDIRTTTGGSISLAAPGGGLTLASDIFGNPLTPPGIVTEFGGSISSFTNGSVDIGQARIFTLRGGDITIWSSAGNIAAGTAPKTVVTAPPTRVVFDTTSAAVQTDLGGLATGGGIGVLASVKGVAPGNVDLIAPQGTVDAGDAGIRATGNLSISAVAVLNASNIQVSGTSAGVPSSAPVAAPPIAAPAPPPPQKTGQDPLEEEKKRKKEQAQEELPSIIVVEVIGYGGGDSEPAVSDQTAL